MSRFATLSFVVASVVACGPDPAKSTPDAATSIDAPVAPIDGPVVPGFDYDSGTWVSQQAVDTAGTISHDPAGVFTSDGTLWGTWMEPDVGATSGEDIWEMKLVGGGWTTSRITDDGAAQAAYNAMATDGTTVHLVYNSRTGPDNDVFYTKHAGTAWSTRIDVTTPTEPTMRHDFQTAVALAPNGDAVIAYVSASVRANGGIADDGEIRVIRVAQSGMVGMPEVAIPTVSPHGCYDPSIVVDGEGTVHIAADCGTVGAAEIHYTNDAGGAFATPTPFAGGAMRDDSGVKLALDPDGRTLHAVWSADAASADCAYARKPPGADWTAAVSTSMDPANDRACALGVDGDGNVLVAWHRPNNDGNEDVWFSWSSDGVTFKMPRLVTPGTDATVEWFPDAILVEPGTGAVHILYEQLVLGSQPTNAHIMHAVLAPPAP